MRKIMLILVLLIPMQNSIAHADIVTDVANVASYVIIQNNPQGDCKEDNLLFYWWFRGRGYNPLIQYGKKSGDSHVWLELDKKIYDSTDPKYNGKSVSEVNNIYVKAKELN